MLNFPPRRIKGRFVPEPLPPPGTFKGQTVLVTGGTAGLGLAASLHFAGLGADVIITCRTKSRGDAAKKKIQHAAPESRVSLMELDMARYSSCMAFAAELRKVREGQGGIDVAVLNAGVLSPRFVASPEGWEMTIQVNTLSTTLLGMLLLDLMKSERPNRNSPARIVFVTSRSHLYPDISHWQEWAEQGSILQRLSDQKYWPAPWKLQQPNYGDSKLLMMYAIKEICERALGPDGEPQVIINSVCPGMVKTNIGHTVADQTWIMKLLVSLYMSLGGKPPDYGARHYITAALRPKEEHSCWGRLRNNVTSLTGRLGAVLHRVADL
ncbi:hypothetical protein N8I77_002977 [Diaporthe amygdali]|uniref:Uncharacterized protein n=1 Tax=Phomopsis amygdali TaxID=1214568 RepID=A0AAD9SH30_PHOAM|nr:hypothetical protein N8I77_002977 [Diaporthe amygdali]